MSYENASEQAVADIDVRGPTSPVNLTVEELVNDYNAFATKSSENVLGLATTILMVEDLGRRDRERFYADVKLDPKGSTARKLRVIGEKLPRFQPFLTVIPNTWTTLYELARLGDDEVKMVVDSGVLHPLLTMREIDEARGVASTKMSLEFPLHVDLYKISTTRRQAEFFQKLEVLCREFGIDMEPMSPKRKQELLRIRAETDDQQHAA